MSRIGHSTMRAGMHHPKCGNLYVPGSAVWRPSHASEKVTNWSRTSLRHIRINIETQRVERIIPDQSLFHCLRAKLCLPAESAPGLAAAGEDSRSIEACSVTATRPMRAPIAALQVLVESRGAAAADFCTTLWHPSPRRTNPRCPQSDRRASNRNGGIERPHSPRGIRTPRCGRAADVEKNSSASASKRSRTATGVDTDLPTSATNAAPKPLPRPG